MQSFRNTRQSWLISATLESSSCLTKACSASVSDAVVLLSASLHMRDTVLWKGLIFVMVRESWGLFSSWAHPQTTKTHDSLYIHWVSSANQILTLMWRCPRISLIKGESTPLFCRISISTSKHSNFSTECILCMIRREVSFIISDVYSRDWFDIRSSSERLRRSSHDHIS